MQKDTSKGILSSLSPQASFFAGAGVIVLLFFIIGFFVLLRMVLVDKPETIANNTQPTAVQQGEPTQAEIIVPPVVDEDWKRGADNPAVTVVEYSDIDCPYCQQFHPTLERLIAEYPDTVQWVYRHYPLDSLHPNARGKAEASECVGELGGQDAFWAFINELYNGSTQSLSQIAVSAGVSQSAFDTCVSERRHADKVEQHVQDAFAAGGQGTPYSIFMVNGEKIPLSGAASYTQLQQFIESVL